MNSQYDVCIFDLDDTLYPLSSGLAPACRKNIELFMIEKLGFHETEASDICVKYYHSHGTTMAGLRAHGYDFDFDDYHKFVHGKLPYHLLKPDSLLRSLLLSLPQRKIVFTNSDSTHAFKCLTILGIEDCFEKIITFETVMDTPPLLPFSSSSISFTSSSTLPSSTLSVSASSKLSHEPSSSSSSISSLTYNASLSFADNLETSNYELSKCIDIKKSWRDDKGMPLVCCKPQIESFLRVLKILDIPANRTLFFDDSLRNIISAKCVGLNTVLVGSSIKIESSDFAISSLHNLKDAIPLLWSNCNDEIEDNLICSKRGVVEFVRA